MYNFYNRLPHIIYIKYMYKLKLIINSILQFYLSCYALFLLCLETISHTINEANKKTEEQKDYLQICRA